MINQKWHHTKLILDQLRTIFQTLKLNVKETISEIFAYHTYFGKSFNYTLNLLFHII